jgi:hypothetical protein
MYLMKRPGRAWISCGLRPLSAHENPQVIRMMRNLGYDTHKLGGYPGYGFRRLAPLYSRGLAVEWDRIRTAVTAGSVPARSRRGPVPEPKSTPSRSGIHDRNWDLIEEMERKRFRDWKPQELFLWQRRKVHVEGVPWIFFFEGYWEPGDSDRLGFEIGVSIFLEKPTSMGMLDRIFSGGFLERMEESLRRLGFDIPMRERPRAKPWVKHGYLSSYYKNILDPARYAAESLALLHWDPKKVISVSGRRSR